MATSTFSKRWRESLQERKWPYRKNRKIENKIAQLLSEQKKGRDIENELRCLEMEQLENLVPACITFNEAEVDSP